MKKRSIWKRLSALVLSAAMVAGSVAAGAYEAKAETSAPTSDSFTESTDDLVTRTISFGTGQASGQAASWIAVGKDTAITDSNLVLLSAGDYGQTAFGESAEYASSTLKTKLDEIYTQHFNDGEKALMSSFDESTVLYVPAALSDGTAALGKNSDLVLSSDNIGTRTAAFWTRSTVEDSADPVQAYVVTTEAKTEAQAISSEQKIVPAFALNTSGMLFASKAVSAAEGATLGTDYILRMKADDTHAVPGTASYTDQQITLTSEEGVEAADVYLYVSGSNGTSDWVYSTTFEDAKVITADDLATAAGGTPDLSVCKIWLEKKIDGVTYAKYAEQETAHTVTAVSATIEGETSASFYEGDTVTVTADAAPSGMVFSGWTVNPEVELDDPTAETVTFIMPAEDVEISATYSDEPVKYYTVTAVNSTVGGKTSATFVAGDTVTVKADAAPSGMVFSGWSTKPSVELSSKTATTVTFTMPAKDVTISATYSDEPVAYYTVKVTNGTVGGEKSATFAAGDTVTVKADAAATGKTFSKWTVSPSSVKLSDATAATTTFTMPAEDVTLKASYSDLTYTTKISASKGIGSEGITSAMKKAGYDSESKISTKLQEVLSGKHSGYSESNTILYDIKYMVSYDNGENWIRDEGEKFPADGKTMTLPYPSGTDKSYSFVVLHMFSRSTTVGSKTYSAGDVEDLDITKTDKGIQFKTYSLSPFLVAWKSSGSTTTKITLSKTSMTFNYTGSTYQLKATVTPSSADQTVTWSSSDESVATVNSEGVVTSVAKGTCTITATTVDGKKATCKVTVKSNTSKSDSNSNSSGKNSSSSKASNSKTGDSNPIGIYVGLIVAAAVVLILLVIVMKKRNKK